jgi:hypothetical protein
MPIAVAAIVTWGVVKVVKSRAEWARKASRRSKLAGNSW